MADISLIVEVQNKGIKTTEQAIRDLNNEVSRVGASAEKSGAVFEREMQKQILASRNVNGQMAKATREWLAGERRRLDMMQESERIATQAAKSEALAIKETAAAERDLEAARKSIVIAQEREAAVMDQLRSKYQAGYRELKIYKAENEQLNLAYKNNIISQEQLIAEQAKLNTAFQKGSGVFQSAFFNMREGMGRFGLVAQQVGYQAGDFFVQWQSGTNVLVAFGQQATQLAGMLWMLPQPILASKVALLGMMVPMSAIIAGIGILIPIVTAVGAAWMRSGQDAKTAADGVLTYKGALKALNDEYERGKEGFLKARFDTDSSGIASAKKQIQDLTIKIAALDVIRKRLLAGGGRAAAQVGLLGIDKLEEEKAALEEILSDLERQKIALDYIEASKKRASKEPSAMYKEDAAYAEKLAKEINDAAELSRRTKDAFHAMAGEMGAVSSSMFSTNNGARELIGNLYETVNAATSLRDIINSITMPNFDNVAILNAKIAAAKAGTSVAGAEASAKAAQTVGRAGGTADQAASAAARAGAIAAEEERLNKTLSDLLNPKKPKSGGGSKAQTQEEYIQQLLREDAQKRSLIDLSKSEQTASEAEFKLREKLRDLKGNVTEEEIQATLRQMDATEKLIEKQQKVEAMTQSFSSTIENAFMSMVDGSKSVADAFKGMLRDILLEIYRQQVVKPIADMAGGFLSGLLSANGTAWDKGVQMYANGGVVGSPTLFGYKGGIGMMGEAGPEAIMPLKRGANGKLGVEMHGGGSQQVSVNQWFNFSANGDESVKKIIAQAAPQIAQMTQKQIIDSRRRGGSMKATFG